MSIPVPPEEIRIGLVGCGLVAQHVHLPVLKGLPGVRVTALAEADPERLSAAAAQAPGAATFADWRALMEETDVDAVVVCLPPALHAVAAVAAFAEGRHVYLEKPLASSLDEAAAILDAWREAGTVGMVGFNFRFEPQVEDARRRLQEGAIGAPIGVRTSFTLAPHDVPAWKRDRVQGGGVLLDLASHHADLSAFLFGLGVEDVTADAGALGGTHAAVQFTLTGGVPVQTLVSLGTVEEHRIEVYGTTGKLTIDRIEQTVVGFTPATLDGTRARRIGRALGGLDPRQLLRSPGAGPSFARALGHFAQAIRGAPFIGPDLLDGARSLAVIEAAERSATSGRREAPVGVSAPR